MEDLITFMKERGIPEENINQMQNDKVDSSVIPLMEDAALAKYITAYGDRVAVITYLAKGKPEDKEHKAGLLERLRNKVKRRKMSSMEDEAEQSPMVGNKNASKNVKRIELGWMDFDPKLDDYKQVRSRAGGGTRHLKVLKTAKIEELLDVGKAYFFPEGKSQKGHVDSFDCYMRDFKGNGIDKNTVQEVYDKSGLKMLRIYFCTKKKPLVPHSVLHETSDCVSNELPLSNEVLPSDLTRTEVSVNEIGKFNNLLRNIDYTHDISALSDAYGIGEELVQHYYSSLQTNMMNTSGFSENSVPCPTVQMPSPSVSEGHVPSLKIAPQILSPCPIEAHVPSLSTAPQVSTISLTEGHVPSLSIAPQFSAPSLTQGHVPSLSTAPQVSSPSLTQGHVPSLSTAPQFSAPSLTQGHVPSLSTAPQVSTISLTEGHVPSLSTAPQFSAPSLTQGHVPSLSTAPQVSSPSLTQGHVPSLSTAPQISSPSLTQGHVPSLSIYPQVSPSSPSVNDIYDPNPSVTDVAAISLPSMTLNSPSPAPVVSLSTISSTTRSELNEPIPQSCEGSTTIKIHRVNIVKEMVASFKTTNIIHADVNFTFINETGYDTGGVSREAYTVFWENFLAFSADGENYRIPALNPEFGLEEWQSVGRILVKGFVDHKVFPLKLAPAFVIAIIFGEESVSPQDLLNSYYCFISDADRTVVKSAVDGKLSEDDKDIFLEILEQEGIRYIPATDEVHVTILQMAHKVIIQKSSYALQAITEIVQGELSLHFINCDAVKNMYETLKPTSKTVCNLIEANPMTAEENQALRYLKQFVRAQTEDNLGKLLHFLTGSRVLSVPKIQIEFTKLKGLERRPVAHTCGPVLELPTTYSCYREFRYEWHEILMSGFLNMDIM